MKTRTLALVLLISPIISSGFVFAHPGGHGHNHNTDADKSTARTWTMQEGGFHVHGRFESALDGNVRIRREDGSLSTIRIDRLIEADRKWVQTRQDEIRRLNSQPLLAQAPSRKPVDQSETKRPRPAVAQSFQPFAESIGLRWDDDFLYVESNGMPAHQMMVGITAWQQQVPLPQNYTASNAWRIPLHPVPAKEPLSAKTGFFRGAIALAVNGVPIFNPIKNDGKTDTFLAGELDEFGGHCGRADDYHYHLPPVHLEATVGNGEPIAYALDGYPIYGYQSPQDVDFAPLDWLNGHKGADGRYHYHATKAYPYLNGGFFGEVTERNGQVDPQPRATGVRPALSGLKGAKITGFEGSDDQKKFAVVYDYRGEQRAVRYTIGDDGAVHFVFDNGSQGTEQATYRPQRLKKDGADQQTPEDSPPGKQRQRGDKKRANAGQPDRKPWIVVHASEMDSDSDGILTRDEMLAEARQAFAAYDANSDKVLSRDEYTTGKSVRSAMAGFIRQHAAELDRNSDGSLSSEEVLGNAARMFDKGDADRDGKVPIEQATEIPPLKKPAPTASSASKSQTPPNIVFILIDDMGWRDVGFMGNTFVETPNIDRLAAEGIRFSQAYSSGPNCAPTRACFLSGQYTPRHGVYTVVDPRHDPGQPHHRLLAVESKAALDTNVVTIAEALQQRGYATACFGMWNLGRGRDGPTTASGQGFDVYRKPQDFGFDQHSYFDRDGKYLTDVLTDAGLHFIEEHRDRPFFLYLPTHAVHAPFDPKPELLQKYRLKAQQTPQTNADSVYAAMIEAVDQNVGRIMDTLRRLKLAENTLVVFTSDNGGAPQHVTPLNGSKGALYEGGIRVPCAVWWSGIEKPGREFEEPILSMDFYPTLLDVATATPPKDQPIDGVSLLPIIKGQASLQREAVYWHFPCYIGRGEPSSAVREGDWKLVEVFDGNRFELYNLAKDPGERSNLAASNPEKTAELWRKLNVWRDRLHAERPTGINPHYDSNAREAQKKGRSKGRQRTQFKQ